MNEVLVVISRYLRPFFDELRLLCSRSSAWRNLKYSVYILIDIVGFWALLYNGFRPELLGVLFLVNIGVWYCYVTIPLYIGAKSSGLDLIISSKIVPHFQRFVSACGDHHRLHWPCMMGMMAANLHGSYLFYFLSWGALLAVDLRMLAVSWAAKEAMKREGAMT